MEAVTYPDAVALAGVLISGYWRTVSRRNRPAFYTEVGRRLRLPDLLPSGAYDPLAQWLYRDMRWFEYTAGLDPANTAV